MITFACPGCPKNYKVPQEYAGKMRSCPNCRTGFIIPEYEPVLAQRLIDQSESRRFKAQHLIDDAENKRVKHDIGRNLESRRVMAGVLALLLGAAGIHKFYLGSQQKDSPSSNSLPTGYYRAAVVHLILMFFATPVSWIIGIVEGILYLSKTDEQFIEMYQNRTKEWF